MSLGTRAPAELISATSYPPQEDGEPEGWGPTLTCPQSHSCSCCPRWTRGWPGAMSGWASPRPGLSLCSSGWPPSASGCLLREEAKRDGERHRVGYTETSHLVSVSSLWWPSFCPEPTPSIPSLLASMLLLGHPPSIQHHLGFLTYMFFLLPKFISPP